MAEKLDNLEGAPELDQNASLEDIQKAIEEESKGQAPDLTEEPKPEVEEETTAPSPVEGQAEEKKEPEQPQPQWYDQYSPEFQETAKKKHWKSVEDAVTTYGEMEKKSTQDAQRISQYKDILSPHAEFDAEGNITGLRQPQPATQTTEGQAIEDKIKPWEDRYNALEQSYGPVKAGILLNAEMANSIAIQRLAPVNEMKADNSIEVQKRTLREKDPFFAKLEPDVNKYLAKLNVQAKLNPQAVTTVYNYVKGEKFTELMNAQKEKETQVKEETQVKTAVIEDQKSKAQVEHPTKTPEEPALGKDEVESMSAAELKKSLGLKTVYRY